MNPRDTDARIRSDARARELGWIAGYTPRETSLFAVIAALLFTALTVVTICTVHWQTIVELWRAM